MCKTCMFWEISDFSPDAYNSDWFQNQSVSDQKLKFGTHRICKFGSLKTGFWNFRKMLRTAFCRWPSIALWSEFLVFPDWLPRGEPSWGSSQVLSDPDLEAERAWLASCIRCWVDDELEAFPAFKKDYRLPTFWWLIMLDTVVRQKTGHGLEQFSSPHTAAACMKILGDDADADYAVLAPQKFRPVRSELQWIGVWICVWFR